MRLFWPGLVTAIAALILPVMSFALSEKQAAQLVLLNRSKVGDLAVSRAEWFSEGRRVVLAGEADESPRLVIHPGPNGDAYTLAAPATDNFSLAPGRPRVAYWKRAADDEETAELTVFDVAGPTTATLGRPLHISEAMPLAWLTDDAIVYADNSEDPARLFLRSLDGGSPRELNARPAGRWVSLQRSEPGCVTARLSTDEGVSVFEVRRTGPGLVAVNALTDHTPPQDPLELDEDGNLIFNTGSTTGLIIDENVTDASMCPDRSAVAYTKDGRLYVSSTHTPAPREIATAVHGNINCCSWSPNLSDICFWGTADEAAVAYHGLLGTEEVTGRFSFKSDVKPSADDRLWVAEKFFTNDFGTVDEPDWATLKAKFVITRVMSGKDRVLVEAYSAGLEPGVVERLTGRDDPPRLEESEGSISIGFNGGGINPWMDTFKARPRPKLGAWLEGTHYVGDILTITVHRQILLPSASPHDLQ
ncbi:MAG: hypothetical protein R6V19_14570 [Armatimonadota bacterium]